MTLDRATQSWTCKAPTITELMAKAIRGHIDCPAPDAVLNIETHLFNTVLVADSCTFDLDVGKHLWLNKQRWSRLVKEYVPREPLDRFVGQACEIMSMQSRLGATANFLFRDPDRYEKKHRWGGCLMGATFRGDNRKAGPATLTFYSRTTYIGYMGLMDAGLAHVIAGEIARQLGRGNASMIGFRWYISSQQLHCFKTLPYIYSQPDLFNRLERFARNPRTIAKAPPTWKHIAKWYVKVKQRWDDTAQETWGHYEIPTPGAGDMQRCCQAMLAKEKYGPFKRIQRRWLEHMGYSTKNVPPSLMISALDFDKAL